MLNTSISMKQLQLKMATKCCFHVIGLSKLNRVVDWFSRRPQMQESLTAQIHKSIDRPFSYTKSMYLINSSKKIKITGRRFNICNIIFIYKITFTRHFFVN